MKKFYVYYFVSLLFIVVLGCQKSVDEQIVGKWKVSEYNIANIDELAEIMTQKMGYPEDMQAQFKETIEADYKKTFDQAEMNFTDSTMNVGSENYTWKYDKENSKFIFTSVDENESFLNVKELKDNVLIADWVFPNSDQEIIISLVLEKE